MMASSALAFDSSFIPKTPLDLESVKGIYNVRIDFIGTRIQFILGDQNIARMIDSKGHHCEGSYKFNVVLPPKAEPFYEIGVQFINCQEYNVIEQIIAFPGTQTVESLEQGSKVRSINVILRNEKGDISQQYKFSGFIQKIQ